jgi:hypothetical protein
MILEWPYTRSGMSVYIVKELDKILMLWRGKLDGVILPQVAAPVGHALHDVVLRDKQSNNRAT